MATSRAYLPRQQNYRFLTTDRTSPAMTSSPDFELDESDLWNVNTATATTTTLSSSPVFHAPFPTSRARGKTSADRGGAKRTVTSASSSVPVNVPDWSKILRDDDCGDRDRWRESDGVYDDDGDGEVMVPPHEFLARQRIASFSVHEGLGRTLKGRDLSRVRNAIWEKTGFQD